MKPMSMQWKKIYLCSYAIYVSKRQEGLISLKLFAINAAVTKTVTVFAALLLMLLLITCKHFATLKETQQLL